ncbi:unnamed protein product [Cuscuta campestris]|uniref:Secreted protein n=1 Tax=Cuscuta campestris TaxID=132261 RepID=A0A484NN86_9ASTE|nr:unnamed protein product [Cuscuta campestris]
MALVLVLEIISVSFFILHTPMKTYILHANRSWPFWTNRHLEIMLCAFDNNHQSGRRPVSQSKEGLGGFGYKCA